jgi:hypothetical protein
LLEKDRHIRAVGDNFLFHIPGEITLRNAWSGISIRGGTWYFYPYKMVYHIYICMLPFDFKEYCKRYSWKC